MASHWITSLPSVIISTLLPYGFRIVLRNRHRQMPLVSLDELHGSSIHAANIHFHHIVPSPREYLRPGLPLESVTLANNMQKMTVPVLLGLALISSASEYCCNSNVMPQGETQCYNGIACVRTPISQLALRLMSTQCNPTLSIAQGQLCDGQKTFQTCRNIDQPVLIQGQNQSCEDGIGMLACVSILDEGSNAGVCINRF